MCSSDLPRPQDDAVWIGIARGDPLGIEITPLMPVDTRTSGRSNPCDRSTDCCCSFEKGSAADLHRLISVQAAVGVTSGFGRCLLQALIMHPRLRNAHGHEGIRRPVWLPGPVNLFPGLLDLGPARK